MEDTYLQSGPCLCCKLPTRYFYTFSFQIRNFKPLTSPFNRADWFAYYEVRNPEVQFSLVNACIMLVLAVAKILSLCHSR